MINSPFLIFPKNNTFSCKLGFEEFLNNLTSSRHRFYYLFPTEIHYFLLPISLVFGLCGIKEDLFFGCFFSWLVALLDPSR
jgi:hypothetical protein